MYCSNIVSLFAASIAAMIMATLAQAEDGVSSSIRPNILWLSTEDIGPHLGCYGDPDAVTPNLDRFAKNSLVYDIAWSNYPVCAPARTTIISGVYACALAAGNMRSEVILPDEMEMFPYYLRQAGYYCTNNSKTDYNFIDPRNKPWDESSRKAHWKNSKPDQPFFAVFNHTGTHESKIRTRPHQAQIDPAGVTLPSYWPDTPEVRQDWAQYHDNITRMDNWFQERLDELAAAGQSDNTIVVFFGDHGSGMPRHKRFAGNSGMHVPFIVHVPDGLKKLAPDGYAAGDHSSRPIGFVDLAATMLSIAGIQPPDYMHGNAFMGEFETPAPKYCYGFRDRMDERPDISRSIRDQRFIYVRKLHAPSAGRTKKIDYQFTDAKPRPSGKRMFRKQGRLKRDPIRISGNRAPPRRNSMTLEADPMETK
jgi:arylsulfatase A-like enzyme